MEEMDQEKLIENVRFYESLYVTTHAKYSDLRFKENAWKEIGKKIKQPAAVCKKTWTNLRDSFRRAVKKKRESRSGRAASKIKKWKFEDEMSFLKPHLQRPETRNNSGKNTADEDWADDNDDSRNEDGDENVDTDGENEYDNPRINVEEIITRRKAKNRKIVKTAVTAVTKEKADKIAPKSVLLKTTLENERGINTKKREEPCSAIHTLFSSIASTVESFSPYYQNIAKSRIFKIITDLEMEQIMQSRNTSVQIPTYATISAENLESYHSENVPHDLSSTLNNPPPPPPPQSQNLSCSLWAETYHSEESIKKE